MSSLGGAIRTAIQQLYPKDRYPLSGDGRNFSFFQDDWGNAGRERMEFLYKSSTQTEELAELILWNIDGDEVIIIAGEAQIQSRPSASATSSARAMRKAVDNLFCLESNCHALLSPMTPEQRDEHASMHVRHFENQLAKVKRRHKGRFSVAEVRIAQLQSQIPRYQRKTAALLAECRALRKALRGEKGAEKQTIVREQNISDDIVIPAQADASKADAPALPANIAAQAARLNVYDRQEWTQPNLTLLFKSGHRYCNVCLKYSRGYKDFSTNAAACNTTPWNFVTKESLSPGTSSFRARYTSGDGQHSLPQAVQPPPTPQARERSRESEEEQDPQPQAKQTSTPRTRKRRRVSQEEFVVDGDEAPEEDPEPTIPKAKRQQKESEKTWKEKKDDASDDEEDSDTNKRRPKRGRTPKGAKRASGS